MATVNSDKFLFTIVVINADPATNADDASNFGIAALQLHTFFLL